jgi:transcriptional regulator with XRE-family HTH domain
MSVSLVLGARIASARRAKGLTQQEFAEAVGVTGNQVSRWERGSASPDPRKLTVIAGTLDINPTELAELWIETSQAENTNLRHDQDVLLDTLQKLTAELREMMDWLAEFKKEQAAELKKGRARLP